MFEIINAIDAYINSKHLSGEKDSIGREKPFSNIVNSARNIWFRATDIDRKDIRLTSSQSNMHIPIIVSNVLLKKWMKKNRFGVVLNDWGKDLATYGSSVLKFVEKGDELLVSVVPWNRLIPDPIDFENNVKIEVLELTPSQLRKNKAYDQNMVESLIYNLRNRKMLDGQDKDSKAGYIKVYEVHGELPLSLLTGKDRDEDTYVQQMHVISLVKGDYDRSTRSYEYEDYTLYSGKEKQDPYFISHLIREDGRTLSRGAVENLFDAQWMVNHSVKMQKDVIDLTSLMILQTADKNYAGLNVLQSLVPGNILVFDNQQSPNGITQINTSHDITQIQNFGTFWHNLSKEITATPDSLRGENAPSGTAWRQVEALRQESHSLFELMKENKALALEDMLRKYVIPHLKTKIDTSEEITAILEDRDIATINAVYVPNEAKKINNKRIKDTILSGKIASNGDLQAIEQDIKGGFIGNERTFKPSEISTKTWKDALKDFEWEVDINPTEEAVDITSAMATLSTLLKVSINDPEMTRFIINKILEMTGQVSPLELPQQKTPQQLSPAPVATGQNQPDFQVQQQ